MNCSRGHGVLVGHAAAVSCVVLGWAEVTEAGLVSGRVVEHLDVLEQHRAQLGSSVEADGAAYPGGLAFEYRPERLHRGVIEAIAGRAERCEQAEVLESVRERERRVLAARALMFVKRR